MLRNVVARFIEPNERFEKLTVLSEVEGLGNYNRDGA